MSHDDSANERCEAQTFGDTPDVLAAFNGATVNSFDILSRTNNGEGHGVDEGTDVACVLVIRFDGRGVAPDVLGCDNFADLLGVS